MSDSDFPDALASQYKLHWYVLESVLGQGGFGITYLARDSNLEKLVAIKEYLPVDTATRRSDSRVSPRAQTQAERYGQGLEGFIREARTLARFNHPNIVRVHSVFQHNGTAYMVMDYEEGETLATLLERRQTLPEGELLDILLPVMDGLALVHAEGFIHRDIKPENIVVRKDGSPVLLDFGSARASLGPSRTLTILVAPGYAPYEQYYASSDAQGPWTDIYSLGATCYRAVTGAVPMDAITRSKGVLGSTREMMAPATERGARRYSAGFLRAVDHALAFSEHDRPQNLDDWRKELTGLGASEPMPLPAQHPAQPPSRPVMAAAPAPQARLGTRWREVASWTGVGAALAGIALWIWPRSMGTETAPVTPAGTAARTEAPAAIAPVVAVPAPVPVPAASSAAPLPARVAEAAARTPVPTPVKAGTRSRSDAPAPVPGIAAESASGRPAVAIAVTAAPAPAALPAPTPAPASAQVQAPAPAPAPVAAPAQPLATVPPPVPAPAPAPATTQVAPALALLAPATAVLAPATRDDPRPAVAAKAAEAAAPTNEKDALAFHRARALKGDQESRYQLGEMYAQGKGVAPSPNQAYLWFGLAARSGHAGARSRQTQIGERLQPAERRQVERQIEQLGKSGE